MKPEDKANLLHARIVEASKYSAEKCLADSRFTKDNFDRMFMALYKEAWENFEKMLEVVG